MDKFLCLTAASGSSLSAATSGNSLSAAAGGGSTFDFTAVFIIISIIVSIAVPVVIFLLGKIKFKGAIKMAFLGIVGFIVFYLIVPGLISVIILPKYSSQNATYVDATIQLVIRIVCLEIGRFLMFFLLRKKNNSWGDAVLFSVGYCIIDTFMIVVGILVPYLITVLSPNVDQVDGLRRELLLFIKKENLTSAKAWRFLLYGIVSFAFGAAHLLSSVLMSLAINKKEKWLIGFALLVDVLVFIPNKLSGFKVWIFANDFVTIPYLLIISVVLYLMVYIAYKNIYMRKEEEIDTSYLEKMTGKKS